MANVLEAPQENIQYISDAAGKAVGVFVPIDVWREIEAERETAYLLKSKTMRRRLLDAKDRQEGISFQERPRKNWCVKGVPYVRDRTFTDIEGA